MRVRLLPSRLGRSRVHERDLWVGVELLAHAGVSAIGFFTAMIVAISIRAAAGR